MRAELDRYLLDKFASTGPSLVGDTLSQRTRVNAICRHHDMYIQPVQGSMYKPGPPFSTFHTRRSMNSMPHPRPSHTSHVHSQRCSCRAPPSAGDSRGPSVRWTVSLRTVISNEPTLWCRFLVGENVTLADCTVFPTAVFIKYMLPKVLQSWNLVVTVLLWL